VAIAGGTQRRAHLVAELLARHSWDRLRLGQLPISLAVPLLEALAAGREDPLPGWSADVLRVVGREDLVSNNRCSLTPAVNTAEMGEQQHTAFKGGAENGATLDGLEGLESEVTRLRWPKDQRVLEARRILQSARPVTVSVVQRPEVSDHDYLEEQEHYLKRLCERTMALPIGRGMAALRTTKPLPTEALSIPQLCLTGRAPPRGTKVELSHIDYSANMEHWPCFHNGVGVFFLACLL
jgi:anaphase-promoting complex subunit 1